MCKYDENLEELVETCWDSTGECSVGSPACPLHNHHTPCNRAWGRGDWVLSGDTECESLEGYDIEEHIRYLLEQEEDL